MPTFRESRFGVALYGDYRQIADDFAGTESPKLKFNFTMSIDFNRAMLNPPQYASAGNDDPYKITLPIKQITRPAPNFIYEDVNYYNFMTKVATRIDYGVVTVTLYDDRTNVAHDIFKSYMESVSPATNLNKAQAPFIHKSGQGASSMLGPMSNGAENGPIMNLRVNHITDHKGTKVIYDFLNPKIQNVVLDELDMTQSDVNTLTFTFVYDTFNVTTESSTTISNTESETESELKERVSQEILKDQKDNLANQISKQMDLFRQDGIERTGDENPVIRGEPPPQKRGRTI